MFGGSVMPRLYSNFINVIENPINITIPPHPFPLPVISTVQGPGTKMVRPHPAFWKFVFGLATCYTLFMVYLLFQTADGARQTLRHLYPELGVELEERTYGGDCRLYIPGQGVNWQVWRCVCT